MSTERAMGRESLVVYVNGEYVPKDHARISIFDFGFLRGDAVFDTSSAWNGRIFKLPAHLERLALSLRAATMQHSHPVAASCEVARQAVGLVRGAAEHQGQGAPRAVEVGRQRG